MPETRLLRVTHRPEVFYRFDKNGKFMNKIGRQGQGPEEYAVGLLFFTDPDNQNCMFRISRI